MALKIAEPANDKSSPWPLGMTRIEIPGGGEELQHSADSLLRDAMRHFADELPVLRKRTDMVETGNYQIALIPLRDLMNRSGSDAPALARRNSVLVLPFTWRDLVTRLRAEVGQSELHQTDDVVGFGAIRMKLSTMEVFRSGQPVTFRRREFKLLHYFISNPAKVISRDELLNEVWGLDNYPCTRTVDSHVWRLRQKLEPDPASPIHFHTVHAVGYKFVP